MSFKITKKNFQVIAEAEGFKIEPEFQFCKTRKFRADWKVEANGKSCLVEYEGVFSGKSRHTGVLGYSNDCEKYNLAAICGYHVLRYTAKNFGNVLDDLDLLLS